MSVQIDVTYEGNLRCRAVHGPSGSEIMTDAPADNMGRAEKFSPTDLVAAALSTCMLTTMGIVADRAGMDVKGTRVVIEKEMVQSPRRRIGSLRARIILPAGREYSEKDMARLRRAAEICPVRASLHPEVQVSAEFASS